MSRRTRLFGYLASLLGCGLSCAQATPQQAALPGQRASALARAPDSSVRAPPREPPGESRTQASSEPDPFLDATLAAALRRELDHGDGLEVHRVEVQVKDGVATLTGEVQTWDDALQAVALAERTRGLRAVVNHLRVEGRWRHGDLVVWQVRRALSRTSGAASSEEIRANRGRVVLGGKVASLDHKQRAERTAYTVSGVQQVDNQLKVQPSVQRTDEELRLVIDERLKSDSYLYDQPVTVAVNDGIVGLSGTVDTLYAWRRALELARVDGARELDGHGLIVSPQRPPPLELSPPPGPEERRAVILDSFRLDPLVPDAGIEVSIENERATLSGEVATLAEKRAAGRLALEADGVWVVVNRLQVRPRAALSDRSLERRVASRLNQHPSVAARNVRVSVERRVAVLSGSVDSEFQSSCAERAAGLVNGVRRVDNRLRLEPSSPHFRDDAAIERALEQELWWDARVDPAKLDVEVQDGMATISGEVDSWGGRDAIIENVFQVAPPRFTNEVHVRELPQLAQGTGDAER